MNMYEGAKRAVIYARVSDPSQVENNSLETQVKTCRWFAEQNNFIVDKVFQEEGVSAKHVFTRPKLRSLIEYSALKKNNISAVIVYKMDRLTRNMEEGYLLIASLAKRGIDIISATERYGNDAAGNLLKNLLMAVGQFDNETKSEKVRDNMKALFRKGIWCWKPPIGYKRPYLTKEDNKGKCPIIHPQLGPIVATFFDNAATGLYSRNQLAEMMNIQGFDIHFGKKANAKTVTKIAEKTFYYGVMYSEKWDEYITGLHKPLTDELTWNKAYSVIFGNKRKHSIQDSNLFPLKGLIRCHICGSKMTSSNPSGRPKTYLHYECGNSKCRKIRINVEKVHPLFIRRLSKLKPSEDVLKIFLATVMKDWNEIIESSAKQALAVESKIKTLRTELKSVRKAKDDGIYTVEEAKLEAQRIREEIIVLEMERSDHRIEQYNAKKVQNFTHCFLLNLDKLWVKLDLPKKKALQNAIYPNGITVDKKEIRTADLSPFFSTIQSLKTNKSTLVIPQGIEPWFSG
jgi:site-specific DNA recombinase